MVTSYHSLMEHGILLLGDELKRQRKVQKVFTGSQRPLSIVDHHTKHVINYKPDVYFILRNNKKLIFEVLDSEIEKQDIIIADVIRSFLIENVDAVIFIYSGNDDDERRIMEALVTIAKGLISKGITEDELPFNKSGTIRIMKNTYDNPEEIMAYLADEFKARAMKIKRES